MSKTTLQFHLYPTPEQARLLMAHCQEYISTVNVLVSAFDSAVLTYKAERLGMQVEQAALPTHLRNVLLAVPESRHNRDYVCAECGWMGHRDGVGAINISRRTGLPDKRVGATGAEARPVDGPPETAPNCEAMISKAKAIARELSRSPAPLGRGVSVDVYRGYIFAIS